MVHLRQWFSDSLVKQKRPSHGHSRARRYQHARVSMSREPCPASREAPRSFSRRSRRHRRPPERPSLSFSHMLLWVYLSHFASLAQEASSWLLHRCCRCSISSLCAYTCWSFPIVPTVMITSNLLDVHTIV